MGVEVQHFVRKESERFDKNQTSRETAKRNFCL